MTAWTDANTAATPTSTDMDGALAPLASGDTVSLATKSLVIDSSVGSGDITITAGTFDVNNTFTLTMDAGGDVTVTAGATTIAGTLTPSATSTLIFGGTVTITGTLGANADYTLDMNANLLTSSGTLSAPTCATGTFTYSGAIWKSPTTFTHNSGTVTFDAAGTTTLGNNSTQFSNVVISDGTTLDTSTFNFTSAGILTVGGGTTGVMITNASTIIHTGAVSIAAGAEYTFSTGTTTIGTSFANAGTTTVGSTAAINGSAAGKACTGTEWVWDDCSLSNLDLQFDVTTPDSAIEIEFTGAMTIDDFTISATDKLTVDAGVTVTGTSDKLITIWGELDSTGTSGSHIVFMGYGQMVVKASSKIKLHYTDLTCSVIIYSTPLIMDSATTTLDIDNSTFTANSTSGGVQLIGSHVIKNSTFTKAGSSIYVDNQAVALLGGAYIVFDTCTIDSTGYHGPTGGAALWTSTSVVYMGVMSTDGMPTGYQSADITSSQDVSIGSFTVDGAGLGTTITQNGNISCADMTVDSSKTWVMGAAATLTVAGDLTVLLGTFTPGSGSVITVAGTLDSFGTFGASTDYTLDLNGPFDGNTSTFLAPNTTGTFTMSGATWFNPSIFTANSGTVTFDRAGTTTLQNNSTQFYDVLVKDGATLASSTLNFTGHDVQIGEGVSGAFTTSTGTKSVTGVLTVGTGATFGTADTNYTLNVDGNVSGGGTIIAPNASGTFTYAGTAWPGDNAPILTHSSGTITFDKSGTTTLGNDSTQFYSVMISSSTTLCTGYPGPFRYNFTSAGTTTVAGNFTTAGSTLSLVNLTLQATGTIDGNTYPCSGSVDLDGTVTGAVNITMDGTGNADLAPATGLVTTFTLNTAGTVTLSNSAQVTTFTATGGTLAGGGYTLTVTGTSFDTSAITISGNLDITLTNTVAATKLDGVAGTVRNFTVNGTGKTATLAADINTATITVTAGILDTSTFDITNTGNCTVGGTLTPNTSTVQIDGNLTVTGTFGGNTAYTLDLNGKVAASSGTLSAPNATGTFTMSGDEWYSIGTFTANSGTVEFDSGRATALKGNAMQFNNILLTGGLDTNGYNMTVSGTAELDEELTIDKTSILKGNVTINAAGVITMKGGCDVTFGTTSAACTLANSGIIQFSTNTTNTSYFHGASSTYKAIITGTAPDWDYGGVGSEVTCKWVDLRQDNTSGATGLTIYWTGDMIIDAFTVSAGDTLDISAGVTVTGASNKDITIDGELDTNGTSGSKVTLTGYQVLTPTDGSTVSVTYTNFTCSNTAASSPFEMESASGVSMDIDNCVFTAGAASKGVRISNGDQYVILTSTFSGGGVADYTGESVYLEADADAVFDNCTIASIGMESISGEAGALLVNGTTWKYLGVLTTNGRAGGYQESDWTINTNLVTGSFDTIGTPAATSVTYDTDTATQVNSLIVGASTTWTIDTGKTFYCCNVTNLGTFTNNGSWECGAIVMPIRILDTPDILDVSNQLDTPNIIWNMLQ